MTKQRNIFSPVELWNCIWIGTKYEILDGPEEQGRMSEKSITGGGINGIIGSS